MDAFVHLVYKISVEFPKTEIFGVTSQLRRAALSVILNFIEGYARNGTKSYKQFLTFSYGSLKEAEYLLVFASDEKYIKNEKELNEAMAMANQIGGVLWKTMQNL